VPGKIWQISAMATMATRAGVSGVVSTGSAMLSTIINIACGLAIVLVFGWRWLEEVRPEARTIAIVLLGLALLGLLLLPFLVPRLNQLAAKLTGRLIAFQAPPVRIVVVAILGNLLAWAMYGIAFMWLVSGVLGTARGEVWQYVAVYAASYVVGYLAFFLPGGIGAREAVMAVMLTSLGLAIPKQSLLVAGASRVWLTLLEIVPGLLFVARDVARRRSSKPAPKLSTDAGPPTD
jgi:MFS family permease